MKFLCTVCVLIFCSSFVNSVPQQLSSVYFLKRAFPKIEFAEKTGLVLGEKRVHIRNVKYPYNASILEYNDGYLLAFRFDVPIPQEKRFHPDFKFTTKIGIVELDKNFEQTKNEFYPIDTGSDYSEDPRLFFLNDELYLFYNDVINPSSPGKDRIMYLAKLNTDFSVSYATCFDQFIKPIEKNWVPIVHSSPSGVERLLFGYSINPHKILGVIHPRSSELLHHVYPNTKRKYLLNHWVWGDPRGGTPAKNMGDHYLSFFHSFFTTQDKEIKYWYVMGAYTFEAEEPFNLISISRNPFIFSTLYSSKLDGSTADYCKRVAYPSGFVEGIYKDKEAFFVSIGENDCATKIIIVDKAKLYESLVEVN